MAYVFQSVFDMYCSEYGRMMLISQRWESASIEYQLNLTLDLLVFG